MIFPKCPNCDAALGFPCQFSGSNSGSDMNVEEDSQSSSTQETSRQFINNLPSHICTILNGQNLLTLWESPGGWEGWLQVELYRYFKNREQLLTRESKEYNNALLRADFCLLFVGGHSAIIEIKAESWGQGKDENSRRQFASAVNKDICKLSQDNKLTYKIQIVIAYKSVDKINELCSWAHTKCLGYYNDKCFKLFVWHK